MIDLYQIYTELIKNGQGEGGLHLESFLTMIRSKLESIHAIPEGQGDVKDQEFSKKEIASLLNFFIYLADCPNKLTYLASPGPRSAQKDIISKLFVDDQGQIDDDAALKKISLRIDQLLEFSSEEGKISKELFDEINKNIDNYTPKTSAEEVLDQHAASSPSDINLKIESSASHSDDKHKNIDDYIKDYMKEYNQILTQEKEFAIKLNEEEKNNPSPEKYSGIGASVEMMIGEKKEITGFKVLSVVKNSHAEALLGLKQGDTLLLDTPVNKDEINEIVNKIRNLDFQNVHIKKGDQQLEISGEPSPRRQFFSTKDPIKMISADEAGINQCKTRQEETPMASPSTAASSGRMGSDPNIPNRPNRP